MGQERTTSHAMEWLKNARDKIVALAEGEKGKRSSETPRVGVALAGGFARGIAHIGVLQVLQEEGIPVHCVAGTSVGALIGVGYCAGVPLAEMEALGVATCFSDFGRWVPSWLGLATNQRMEKYLTRLTTAKTFEELKTPMAISATDINAGVTVYYSSGPIAPALRASCAYPGLFVPIQYEGRTLVDGFLTSPVPVEGAMLLGADVVIAVYLETTGVDNPRTAVDVISRSFNIIQRHADITWRQQADVIIEPDVQKIGWEDFCKTPEMVAAGREATKKALPEIRAAIQAERRDSAESSSQPSATSTDRG